MGDWSDISYLNEFINYIYIICRYSWNYETSCYCSIVGFLTDEDSSMSHQHRICIQITDRWNHATLYSIWNIKRQGMNDDSFEKEMYGNSCSCVLLFFYIHKKPQLNKSPSIAIHVETCFHFYLLWLFTKLFHFTFQVSVA